MKEFADRRFADRYEVLEELGSGGMAVVLRAQDRVLGREVALKQCTDLEDRFSREILLTSRLTHPNIMTVLDAGLLNGKLTFVMPIVEGVTLRALIGARFRQREVHGRPVTLRRVIDALRVAADAVGFAHGRDVVHRDLKPDNVMVGPHGEVVVLDWGIAKVLGEEGPDRMERPNTGLTDIVRAQDLTDGLLGTPGYVSPENFEDGLHGPPSDVFALGAVLYAALCGRTPFKGKSNFELLMALKKRRRRAVRGPLRVPRGLAAVCRRALAWDPVDRYPTATEMARDLEEWLEGSRQREVAWNKADDLVDEAEVMLEQVAQSRKRSVLLRQDAALRKETQAPHDDLAEKEVVWALEDHAEAADLEGDLAEQHALDLLLGAKSHVPEHDRAGDLLTQTLRDSHMRLEAAGHLREAARVGHTLRFHDDQGRYSRYLEGDGSLTLRTDTPVRVELVRLEPVARRLLPTRRTELGMSPVLGHSIPFGSYLLVLGDGTAERVVLPVFLKRRGIWPPRKADHGDDIVRIPELGSIRPWECLISAGFYATRRAAQRWQWCDGFVMARDPVTWDGYGRFLEAHPDWAPEVEPGPPNTPVHSVPVEAAEAYARWFSEIDGRDWRLPLEVEWEKAAGGVDGRRFVWGPHADSAWGRFRDSLSDGPRPMSVHGDTLDESVYGVRGMAGNIADWCVSASPNTVVARGGAWLDDARRSEISVRRLLRRGTVSDSIGFRLVRDC